MTARTRAGVPLARAGFGNAVPSLRTVLALIPHALALMAIADVLSGCPPLVLGRSASAMLLAGILLLCAVQIGEFILLGASRPILGEIAIEEQNPSIIDFYLAIYAIQIAVAVHAVGSAKAPTGVLAISVGLAFLGTLFAVPAAHDHLHSRSAIRRVAGKIVLCALGLPHFAMNHVSLHHGHLGTRRDPDSPLPGENFYTYFIRAHVDGLFIAAASRDARLRLAVHNRVQIVNWVSCSWLVLLAVYSALIFAYGLGLAILIAVQISTAWLFIGMANYIQHYGLVRRVDANRAEAIGLQHSWNSGRRVDTALLFGLMQHSTHHASQSKASRCVAPLLPSGAFGVALTALVPVLWFAVMDDRARRVNESLTRKS